VEKPLIYTFSSYRLYMLRNEYSQVRKLDDRKNCLGASIGLPGEGFYRLSKDLGINLMIYRQEKAPFGRKKRIEFT
jgi:hypothetical protein